MSEPTSEFFPPCTLNSAWEESCNIMKPHPPPLEDRLTLPKGALPTPNESDLANAGVARVPAGLFSQVMEMCDCLSSL